MTTDITIPKHIAEQWLLLSFRYALGRKTYVTDECKDWLIEYWDLLRAGYQKQVQQDIRYAIERNEAGMEMDEDCWKEILKLKVKNELL